MNLTEKQEKVYALHQEGKSNREIARIIGINESGVRGHLKGIKNKAAKEGADPGFLVKGKSTLYDSDGEVKIEWVKTEREKEDLIGIADEIIASLQSKIPRYPKKKRPKISKDAKTYMNSYIFGDSHLNMYSWGVETGADWDIQIAVERHTGAMLDMIENSMPAHTGRFISLGDLLHSDSLKPVTLNQTAVDVDGRLGMAIDATVKFCRACIDLMLEKYIIIDVVLARGNHPPTLELLLSKMLDIAYEKEPRVNVIDNTPKHIPLVFGKNFQLITHGDRLSHQRKADIATSKFKHLHGAANFTHILSGHLHHHDSKELSGVKSEIFQVLPTPDSWHVEGGFVQADQSACSIRYHANGGIIDQHFANPRFFVGDILKEQT